MKFSKLITAAVFSAAETENDPDISVISSYSENCVPGSLFICIKGLHNDGHEHIERALENGAAAVIVSENRIDIIDLLRERQIPYAVSDDTREAEARLVSRIYGDPWKDMKMFAVTGTNGKTSVVSMLKSIYTLAGSKCEIIGTLTGKLTTPDPGQLYKTLRDFYESGTECVFMETSSHALALGKLAPIEFDYGIFTNLTPEHLDFHGSMENYAAAKAKLFQICKIGILNADDKYYSRMLDNNSCKTYLCSSKDDSCDFVAKNKKFNGIYGIQYDFLTLNRLFRITSTIPGAFTVMNTLEAAAAAYVDGIPVDIIRAAIGGFRGVKGRIERVILPTNDFSIYIDFAHTPDALENILNTVRGFMKKGQRLVLLFGCGGDRDHTKRPVMGGIAARLADYIIITADNSRTEQTCDIINDILKGIEGGCPYTVIENRREAIEYAVSTALENDVILLAGKGHEEYEIMPDGTHPFSEKAIAENAVEKLMKSKGLY